MIIINVKEGESVERALRRYKRKYDRIGVKKEVRGKQYYRKPSEEKKEVVKKAINREQYYAAENY